MSRFGDLMKLVRLRPTLGYYSMFVCLGFSTGVLGPTLPSLAAQTGVTIAAIGSVFLVQAIGYTIGTFLAGRVFDRVKGHPVLGVSQIVSGILFFLVPFMPSLALLLAILAVKGFGDGFVNTGNNTLLVWTYGDKSGPFMNGLHFCFGLGAFLSPLLAAALMETAWGYASVYRILALGTMAAGLHMLLTPRSPVQAKKSAPDPSTDSGSGEKKAATQREPMPWTVAIPAMLFLFFYVGAEIAYGGWIFTYAVSANLSAAAGAAYLTSGFWLSFTFGRLVSIPLATRFSPRTILPIAFAGGLAGLILTGLLPGSLAALWIGTVVVGFFMAPMWPTGYTLAGQTIRMSGRVSAFILLGDSFGGMILPWLVGQVMTAAGPRAMVFLVLGSLVCTVVAYLFMAGKKKASRSIDLDA